MKRPSFQFYPGDWLKDPQLSLCAPATRGVWIDLLCAMHEFGRVGNLCGTREQLARLARCVPAELALALTDLQTTGAADVADRNGVVTVTCRRMERESKRRENAAERQGRHRELRSGNDEVTPASSSSASTSPLVVPPSLDEPVFVEAWSAWLAHRQEIKKPVTNRARDMALKKLGAMGVQRAVAALEHSVMNGWQGIFEPDYRNQDADWWEGKDLGLPRPPTQEEVESIMTEAMTRAEREA